MGAVERPFSVVTVGTNPKKVPTNGALAWKFRSDGMDRNGGNLHPMFINRANGDLSIPHPTTTTTTARTAPTAPTTPTAAAAPAATAATAAVSCSFVTNNALGYACNAPNRADRRGCLGVM